MISFSDNIIYSLSKISFSVDQIRFKVTSSQTHSVTPNLLPTLEYFLNFSAQRLQLEDVLLFVLFGEHILKKPKAFSSLC